MDIAEKHVLPGEHTVPRAVLKSRLGPMVQKAVRKKIPERFQSAQEFLDAIKQTIGTGELPSVSAGNLAPGAGIPMPEGAGNVFQAPPDVVIAGATLVNPVITDDMVGDEPEVDDYSKTIPWTPQRDEPADTPQSGTRWHSRPLSIRPGSADIARSSSSCP